MKTDLVVHPADKRCSIVILDKTNYLQEKSRILGDGDTYGLLTNNHTFSYKKELSILIDKGFNAQILDKKEKSFLVLAVPHIPTM